MKNFILLLVLICGCQSLPVKSPFEEPKSFTSRPVTYSVTVVAKQHKAADRVNPELFLIEFELPDKQMHLLINSPHYYGLLQSGGTYDVEFETVRIKGADPDIICNYRIKSVKLPPEKQ